MAESRLAPGRLTRWLPLRRGRADGAARRARPARTPGPFSVVRDIDGPRVRLGAVWFAVTLAAVAAGRLPLAMWLAGAAALGAGQLVPVPGGLPPARAVPVARAARRAGERDSVATGAEGVRASLGERVARTVLDPPMRLPAALAAAALPLAATAGSDTLVAALGAGAVVVLVYRLSAPAVDGAASDVATTLVAAWSMGLAAASPVLVHRLGTGAAAVLVVLAAAYDAGDFIVGTGTPRRWEGPAAGIATVVVLAFTMSVVAFEPLGTGGTIAVGAVACVLLPLGPPCASVLLGSGSVRAGYVRRLDSLLVFGPVAAYTAAAIAAA